MKGKKIKGDCIIWTGALQNGYGKRRGQMVHRVVWAFVNGPIPEGLVIDHMCRVRACCNPDHLRAVTPAVNALENNDNCMAVNARQTHCPKGHRYNRANMSPTALEHGYRRCLVCAREYQAEYQRKRRLTPYV